MMLRAVSAIYLCLLLSQVNALITTDAKCLAGYEWTFSSIRQSPCDIAAELAAVCAGGQFNLEPLDSGYVYAGPTQVNQNSCRCSSVYYSLLSACAYCQGRNYIQWSLYNPNCTTVYVGVYNQQIPVGVKVPAYAYQNISVSNTFNVTLAQSMGGIESSRPSSSSTSSSASTSGSGGGGSKNTAAIVGGVVGGVVLLGILAALITFLIIRSRRKQKSPKHSSSFQQSPKMAYTPTTMPTLVPSINSPPPGGPATPATKVYDPNDPSTYPVDDANLYDPYRQLSPPTNMTPTYTGNSARHSLPPQTMPQNTGGHSHYTGVPEL